VLCERCQAKINSGLYERWEVDVMKALLDLEESYKELRSASYRKALRIGDNIYILLDGLKAVSRGLDRALINKLSHLGVKKVHLVSGASDPRSLISSLLGASISSLNLYYAPDGSVYYVAKVLAPISARNADREEVVKRVFKLVTGNDIVIEYEEGLTEVSQVKGPKLEKEKLEEWLKRLER
jgi:transcription antitermination factor NusA-like protein